ncbi:hypothetical protein IFM89_036160 [Coptis chinensis]|uniref:F-box domain-containing protein n=1 Tax=Coptis chinensis TaxID=261450 RepID=A0A835H4T9_9MAGN|nr:hypothetical protein IFM89_036160 [Coptis chinensis]
MEGSNLQFLRQSCGKCEDRLSFLPESILHHILSFLPTKCAIGISILATRWRYYWTSVPILDFSDDLLRSTTRSYMDPFLKDKFMSFVYRVLLLHDSDIHRFCLTCSHTYHVSHFNAWVSAVLKRKVKELVIKLPSGLHSIGLHNYLFRCGSLAILHIKGVGEKLPALITFSSLKVLHLHLTRFYWDKPDEQVTFNLPVLEEFRMENSILWNVNIIVFAPLLMSLYIYEAGYDFRDYDWKMKICAENLISLTMISRCLRAYSLNCLPTLVDASKYLVGTRELCNVKDLVVSSDIVEGIVSPELTSIVPKLFKVTNLGVINGDYILDGSHFVNLLCQVPNIESLVFPDGLALRSSGEHVLTLTILDLDFLPHLKTVEVRDDRDAVRIFRNCPSFEELSIVGCYFSTPDVLQFPGPNLREETLSCLSNAAFEFASPPKDFNGIDRNLIECRAFEILERVRNVRKLALEGLYIEASRVINWYPNLQTLCISIKTLSLTSMGNMGGQIPLEELNSQSMLKCLRKVEIKYFGGSGSELDLVRFFAWEWECDEGNGYYLLSYA